MNEGYKLYNGDCLEIMKDIPDKAVDMILCDLPYGTTSCRWDSVIDFNLMWKEYERIITDNGAILLFGSEPFSTYLRMSNIQLYKYDWIWIKNQATGHLEAKNKPLKKHEIISLFSKGASANGCKNRITYNPQGLIEVNRKYKNSTNSVWGSRKGRKTGSTGITKYTNYPNTLLEFSKDKSRLHPTQKPIALLEYLIKTYTFKNEAVLDNCMGSGSTGVACLNTNRKFIGIEKDENYFNIAKKRIENTYKELNKQI